jgi:hypothetical protein
MDGAMTLRWIRAAACLAALGLAAGTLSCSRHDGGPTSPAPTGPPRTFRMGFSAIPPRADPNIVLPTLELSSQRADGAIMHAEPPWDSLLAGLRADSLVLRNLVPLANYYQAKGLQLVVTLDATNGLDRSSDDAMLVAAGRSLTEPAIQLLYRRYAVAVDSLLHPHDLGLAAETNLIRAAAPPALYAAVVQVANDAAADVRARDPAVKLYVSIQVEVAWGRLTGSPGPYVGIATDLADFPFIDELGLSTYPYLAGFAEPEEVPLDYFARIPQGTALPVMVVEGGWSSASVGGVVSSPEKQARWMRREVAMLDSAKAIGIYPLTFTDLDLTGVPLPPGSILPLFAALGLVTSDLAPKPALAPWDSAFARPRR